MQRTFARLVKKRTRERRKYTCEKHVQNSSEVAKARRAKVARLIELRAFQDGLRLLQAVRLDLAVAEALVEVHRHEVTPRRNLLQVRHLGIELIVVGRHGLILVGQGLLISGHVALEIGFGSLLVPDGSLDVRNELVEGSHGVCLLLLGLRDVLLDVRPNHLQHRSDARALALRTAVVALKSWRGRRRRLASCHERLLCRAANRNLQQAVVGVELLQRRNGVPDQLHGGLVLVLRRHELPLLVGAVLSRILHLDAELGNLSDDVLHGLVGRVDLRGEAVHGLYVRVDLLRDLLRLLRGGHALLLAALLRLQVVGLLRLEIGDDFVDHLDNFHKGIRLIDVRHIRRLLVHQFRDEHSNAGVPVCQLLHHTQSLRLRVVHVLHRVELREEKALRIEGLLERVAGVVRTQDTNGLLDAGDLLGAEALALGPLLGALLARRLRVRDVPGIPLVLGRQVLQLLLARRQSLGARALLPGLVEQRLLGGGELILLRAHERIEVRGGLLLGSDSLVQVVGESVAHVSQDLLNAARARLVLLLERRRAVQFLPVHVGYVQDLVEIGHVVLRQEALTNRHDLLELLRHGAEDALLVVLRGLREHVDGLVQRRKRLVHLVFSRKVVLVLLVAHLRLFLDGLLQPLDLLLQLHALPGQLHASAREIINVRLKLGDPCFVCRDGGRFRIEDLGAPALELVVQPLLGLPIRFNLLRESLHELSDAGYGVQLQSSCPARDKEKRKPHYLR